MGFDEGKIKAEKGGHMEKVILVQDSHGELLPYRWDGLRRVRSRRENEQSLNFGLQQANKMEAGKQ